MPTIIEAKERLDLLISKARVDLYKPIHIAEVLHHSRIEQGIDINQLESFRRSSIHWRDKVTKQLLGKISTSSARYQHDVWNESAMPLTLLTVLDRENRELNGAVERYIYLQFAERQKAVTAMMSAIEVASPESFDLRSLLALFITTPGIRRSVDKAYEIVTYSLLETIVTGLNATVTIRIPEHSRGLLDEFSELATVLLGISGNSLEWSSEAHLYRVGVTNAADRGLDMWSNFGPAIQVKHLTLDEKLAKNIIDQVESDNIVVVCQDAHAATLDIVIRQIGWGRRVRGVLKESELVIWYDRCLRGKYANLLASRLLKLLREGFQKEFPQVAEIISFCRQRGYLNLEIPERWETKSDE